MDNSERRQHPRKAFNDYALLQIGTEKGDIFERAYIADISLGGICFTNLKELRGFEPLKGRIEPNNHVLAFFHENQITVFGTVSRFDPSSGQLALTIKRATDEDLWEQICL